MRDSTPGLMCLLLHSFYHKHSFTNKHDDFNQSMWMYANDINYYY